MNLRTELLFKPGTGELSPLGYLVLAPPRRRRFPDNEHRERLEELQDSFFALLSLYQCREPLAAMRRYLGRNVGSLDDALRRCAWLLPRMDRELSAAQADPHAGKCGACPWITGRFEDRDCPGRVCPGASP